MTIRSRPILAAVGAAATLHALAATAYAAATTSGGTAPAASENAPVDLESAPQAASTPGLGGGSLVRTIVGLAIVIAVIYGVAWVLRRTKSSKEEKASGAGLGTLATVPLGAGAGLHLVRVGSDVVLVGVADHVVTPIRSYTAAESRAKGLLPDPTATGVPVSALSGGGAGRTVVRAPAASNGHPGGAGAQTGAQTWMGHFLVELRRRTVRG